MDFANIMIVAATASCYKFLSKIIRLNLPPSMSFKGALETWKFEPLQKSFHLNHKTGIYK